ncbi:MAG: ArsR/SmtB family transcription factor [Acidimicrobiales bacterium]
MIFALPDLLLIGVRAAPADPRAGLEPVANRLKAVAEPTRLAILNQLAGSPSTVTELARQFGVAQPTMSNHIKLLLDAGLVTNAPGRGRRELVADQRSIADLMSELGTALAFDSPPAG